MDFTKIKHIDYSKIQEFERIGYTYTKIAEDEKYLVWEMKKEEILNYYVEVWKKRYTVDYDGTMPLRAPGDEQFGNCAWCYCGKKEVVAKQIKDRFGISIL